MIDPNSNTVRLAHFSIDEYLRERQFPFITSGHQTVSLACVNYMLLPWLPGGLEGLRGDDDLDDASDQGVQSVKISLGDDKTAALSSGAALGQTSKDIARPSPDSIFEAQLGFADKDGGSRPSSQAGPAESFHDTKGSSPNPSLEKLLNSLRSLSGGGDGILAELQPETSGLNSHTALSSRSLGTSQSDADELEDPEYESIMD